MLIAINNVSEIENWGTGFYRIRNACLENGNPLPEFDERSGAFVTILKPIGAETTQEIVNLLKRDPKLTRKKLAEKLGTISEDGVKYHLNKLVKEGRILRKGSTKSGYWEVL